MFGAYEDTRRVTYGDSDGEYGRAVFVPVCPKCGRYVKSDTTVKVPVEERPNATCKKCGRVQMPFEGYL